MYLVIFAVVAFVLWGAHKLLSRVETRKLRGYIADRDAEIARLNAQVKQLNSAPSEREAQLREELNGYVNLLDTIQVELTKSKDLLTLSSTEERLAGIIDVYRPKRRI